MLAMAIGDIGQRIREVRRTYKGVGMDQQVLAEAIGISQSRLSSWERGRHDPHNPEIINKIARVLEVDPVVLLHGRKMMRTVAEPTGKIKIYGAIGADSRGNASSIDSSEVEVPIQFARDDFGAMFVDGDSMLPLLHPGDTAIFNDSTQVKPNQIIAAEIEGHIWVIKKAVFENGRFILRSLNPSHPDLTVPFRMTGFLVGFVRDDGPERLIRLNPYGIRD